MICDLIWRPLRCASTWKYPSRINLRLSSARDSHSGAIWNARSITFALVIVRVPYTVTPTEQLSQVSFANVPAIIPPAPRDLARYGGASSRRKVAHCRSGVSPHCRHTQRAARSIPFTAPPFILLLSSKTAREQLPAFSIDIGGDDRVDALHPGIVAQAGVGRLGGYARIFAFGRTPPFADSLLQHPDRI